MDITKYYTYNLLKKLYYLDKESLTQEEDILEEYTKEREENGIPLEMIDKIANVNGSHIYKIISSKDIDWENVLLPNSAVPETNWGTFDEDRRWPSNTQLKINDVYELMNVIDYLLCACEDLWSEINKLKYGDGNESSIWYVVNCAESIYLMKFNQVYSDDFNKNNTKGFDVIKLDPTAYFSQFPTTASSSNSKAFPNFGIATQFHKVGTESSNDKITRVVSNVSSRNGVLADIARDAEIIPKAQTTQNEGGIMTNVYGYSIDGDLHFYPGFQIDNFISNSNIISDVVSGINTYNKVSKLKYSSTFFRTPNNEFKKVYLKSLYNFTSITDGSCPYFLYYIDDTDEKKHIIYIGGFVGTNNQPVQSIVGTQVDNSSFTINSIDTIRNKFIVGQTDHQEYLREYVLEDLSDYPSTSVISDILNENIKLPILYVVRDEFSINLTVTTPKTTAYDENKQSIKIFYYKDTNTLSSKVYAKTVIDDPNTDENEQVFTEINSITDITQTESLLYGPQRYNLPSSTDIKIEVNAKWLYDRRENAQNNVIKIDDEWIDDIVLHSELGVDNDEINPDPSKYYKYDSIDPNTGKRVFTNFNTVSELKQYARANKINDLSSRSCTQLYKQMENPYYLKSEISYDALTSQLYDYDDVVNEINEMELEYDGYKTLSFNHELSPQFEQIKFDINLEIEETSKVSGVSQTIPINLNKVHEPKIRFTNYRDIENEIKEYRSVKTVNGSTSYIYPITYYLFVQGENRYEKYDKANSYALGDIYIRSYSYYCENYADPNQNTSAKVFTFDTATFMNLPDVLNNSENEASYYDNTIENKGLTLNIAYSKTASYVNLFGGFFTPKQYGVQNISESSATIYTTYVNQQSETRTNNFPKLSYMFNIDGLGFNYRLHGADMAFNSNMSNATFKEDRYDLTSNAIPNSSNNINKNLGIKIDDRVGNDEFQMKYISHSTSSNNIQYTKNEYEYYYGDDSMYIDTMAFSVTKKNIRKDIQPTGKLIANNNDSSTISISYYIPVSYMYIKSSTFYPNPSYGPTKREIPKQDPNEEQRYKYEYDFNDPDDVAKMSNYINSWTEESSNYHPITLSFQLQENLSANVPFFRKSNEAKMKFDIKRILSNESLTIGGNNTSYIIPNCRYYLSNLITARSNEMENSIGSFFSYDENKDMMVVNEIYSTQNEGTSDSITNLSGISGNRLCPSPIQFGDIIGQNTYKYQYDIYKVSELNKLQINGIEIVDNEHLNPDDNQVDSSDVSAINTVINTHIGCDLNTLFYVEFKMSLFTQNPKTDNSHLKLFYRYNNNGLIPIRIRVQTLPSIKGNKNYLPANLNSENALLDILPLYRIYYENDNSHPTDRSYTKKTIYSIDDDSQTKEIEIFEYRMTDVYEYYTNNGQTTFKKLFNEHGLGQNENKTPGNYFEDQINAFLNYRIFNEQYFIAKGISMPSEENSPLSMSSEIYLDE